MNLGRESFACRNLRLVGPGEERRFSNGFVLTAGGHDAQRVDFFTRFFFGVIDGSVPVRTNVFPPAAGRRCFSAFPGRTFPTFSVNAEFGIAVVNFFASRRRGKNGGHLRDYGQNSVTIPSICTACFFYFCSPPPRSQNTRFTYFLIQYGSPCIDFFGRFLSPRFRDNPRLLSPR